jgi:hypothetical protein
MHNGNISRQEAERIINSVRPQYKDLGGMIKGFLGIPQASEINTENMGTAQRNLFEQADRITPELLAAVEQVESGGDPNAKSDAGALGVMQIIPSEDMGYGIGSYMNPGENPEQDRAIAAAYLAGIANENPDYELDEVLQAYNAGPTRFAKFKAGQGKPLTQETIDYPGKVAEAMGVPLDQLSDIPEPSDDSDESILSPVGKVISEMYNNPAGAWDPMGEFMDRALGPVPTASAINTENMGPEQKKIYEAMLMQDLAEATERDLEAGGIMNGMSPEGLRGMGLYNANNELEDAKEYLEHHRNQGTATEEMIEAVEEKQNAVEEEKQKILDEEQSKIVEADEQAAIDARADEVLSGDANPEEAASTAEEIVGNTDPMTPEGELEIDNYLESLKNNEEESSKLEGMAGKVSEWFSTAFSDLFSGPELARMAVMYAGSRVMGYNHSNSLNYSMKGYMKNVDANVKARQEFITDDDNLKKYTKKSLELYRKTGKLTDLDEKPTSAGVKKRGDKIYHRQLGVLPTVIGTDDIERVVINGKKYRLDDSAIAPFLEDYQESLHDEGNIKRSFRTDGKIYLDSVNQNREADKQVPEGEIIKISDEAITLYNTKKLRYGGMQAASRADLMRNINLAQDDYYKAYALHLEDPDENRKPQSLEEFYNARMISIDTGGVLSYNDIQGTEARRFAKIDKTWGDRAYKEANEDPKKASIAYKRIIKQYKDAWDKYTIMANSGDAKKNFLNAGGEKINPFLNWVSQCQQGNKDALKVFEIVKKQK